MIQMIDFGNSILFACLLLWAIARVLEVWLKVYEKAKGLEKKEE